MARYAAQVAQWLREDPAISAIEILRRAQALGYRGGKSALYELVRRVRTLDESPAGSRQLIVVAPDREHLYNFFKRAFEGNATVQIVLDRRVERPAHPEPLEGTRRQRNRRSIQRAAVPPISAAPIVIVSATTVGPTPGIIGSNAGVRPIARAQNANRPIA